MFVTTELNSELRVSGTGRKQQEQVLGSSPPLEGFDLWPGKALSNLVWPHGRTCSGQELGLETSHGPCQPQLSGGSKTMKGRNFTPHRQLNPLIPLPTGQCTLTLVLICDQCALGKGRLIKRTSSEGKWQFMSVSDAFCHLYWIVWFLCWARGIRGLKNASFTCYQVDAFVRIQILISVTNARNSSDSFAMKLYSSMINKEQDHILYILVQMK